MRTPPFTGGKRGRCSRSSVARMEARRGGSRGREIWGECMLYNMCIIHYNVTIILDIFYSLSISTWPLNQGTLPVLYNMVTMLGLLQQVLMFEGSRIQHHLRQGNEQQLHASELQPKFWTRPPESRFSNTAAQKHERDPSGRDIHSNGSGTAKNPKLATTERGTVSTPILKQRQHRPLPLL